MKNLVLPLFMILIGGKGLQAQQKSMPFKLTGTATGVQKDTVSFSYLGTEGKMIHAKELIKDDRFTISGHIDGPQSASIAFKSKGDPVHKNSRDQQLFIEPAAMTITIDPDHTADFKLTGSKTQLDMNAYNELLKPVQEQSKPVYAAIEAEKDPVKKKELRKLSAPYQALTTKKTYEFFVSHPDSYVTEYLLQVYGMMISEDSTRKVYNALSPALKQNSIGKRMGQIFAATDAVAVGNTVENFSTTDVNGKPISLSDFKGKYILVDFWASWCVPCRKSHPHLRAIYNKYKGQGLEIIGVADDDPRPAVWRTAIAQDSIGQWHHVLGGGDMDKKIKGESNPKDIMSKFGITALPTKFLIGPDGRILARVVGDDTAEIDTVLLKAFKQ